MEKWPFFSVYDHRRYFSNKFKVLIASFKSPTKTNFLFINHDHIQTQKLTKDKKPILHECAVLSIPQSDPPLACIVLFEKLRYRWTNWWTHGFNMGSATHEVMSSCSRQLLTYSLWSGACQHQTKCPELICLCSRLQQLHCVLWVGEMNMYKPSVVCTYLSPDTLCLSLALHLVTSDNQIWMWGAD